MVPLTDSVARRRCREKGAASSSSSSLFVPKLQTTPRITCGKQNQRPLSLTGRQFRRNVYALPSDDEQEDDRRRSASRESPTGRRDSDSAEAELSGIESRDFSSGNARRNATPLTNSRRTKAGAGRPPSDKTTRAAQTRKGKVKPARVSKTTAKPVTRTRKRPKETATPPRRLSVNELFLVTSPLNFCPELYADDHQPEIALQDPVHDRSSSSRKRRSSDSFDSPPSVPLSVIRKRFKPPKSVHKSLRKVRSVEATTTIFGLRDFSDARGRDGFEDFELTIQRQRTVAKTPTKSKELLIPGFETLQLRSGPLPDVVFEISFADNELNMRSGNDNAERFAQQDHDDPQAETPTAAGRQIRHIDTEREKLIRAQLSSISAPARVPSESSDNSEAAEEEEHKADGDVAEDIVVYDLRSSPAEADYAFDPSVDGYENLVPDNVGGSITQRRVEQPSEINHGVTLDFRPPTVPGQLPRQPLGKQQLVEVNEAIFEVPESDIMPPVVHNMDPRLRSILKHSTPMVPDSTTRASQTAVNTRRNSVVNALESRYFTNAVERLHDSERRQHQIIPRRRSSYFYDPNAEVLDTDRILPETSPEPVDYAMSHSWHMPKTASDLKYLARTDGRGYGTLS